MGLRGSLPAREGGQHRKAVQRKAFPLALDLRARPNSLPWPPIVLAAALALGFALERAAPWGALLPDWAASVGYAIAALGLALDVWAMATMTQARTNILPNRGADRLVTSGPFAISRNPIYLGNTLLTFGVGLAARAPWLLPLAVVAALLVERLAIRREEAHLDAKFGAAWKAYAATTPRWLGLARRR
jgi:protein-S-isoprenylcysteine O-methyltransferase Ste14